MAILKIEDEECEDWTFECTDCCIDGKDMLRCILMTSSKCLLNNKAKNITSTTSCPKDTQRKILKLTLINICKYIHLYTKCSISSRKNIF